MSPWLFNRKGTEDGEVPQPGSRLTRSGNSIPEGLDEAMVRAVVDEFYRKARLDPVIGPVFDRVIEDDAWPAHLDKITDFWSSMLLGSGRYQGRPMPKHLAIGELAEAHFERWLALFRQTVEAICPPHVAALFVDRAERVGNNFRYAMAVREGRDTRTLMPMKAGPPPPDAD
ncbi:MAG: group III truncated hemoglobin [Bauldia sp.]|jgi:hemoglobin